MPFLAAIPAIVGPMLPTALGIAAVGAAGIAVGSALSKNSGGSESAQPQQPQYDAKAEENKAAQQAAEANKRRMLAQTDTTKTSALGETTGATTGKKTLLGQ